MKEKKLLSKNAKTVSIKRKTPANLIIFKTSSNRLFVRVYKRQLPQITINSHKDIFEEYWISKHELTCLKMGYDLFNREDKSHHFEIYCTPEEAKLIRKTLLKTDIHFVELKDCPTCGQNFPERFDKESVICRTCQYEMKSLGIVNEYIS